MTLQNLSLQFAFSTTRSDSTASAGMITQRAYLPRELVPAMRAMTLRTNATSATMPEMTVEEPRQADAMAKLTHPGVVFTDFVQVKLVHEDGFAVATSERFDAYGTGDDAQAALAELASMLVDEYQELSNSDVPLSNYLRLKLQALNTLIRLA